MTMKQWLQITCNNCGKQAPDWGGGLCVTCRRDKATRIEIIDETGRAYVRWNTKIKLSYQDDGRTLKIFVEEEAK